VVAAALQDVADTLASRQALAERLAQTAAAARAAEDARDLTRTRVELGLSSKLALLTAEDQAINARHGVQVLEARAFTLDVSLIRALGGGYRA
ncbi:TolC family protein, partial [Acinetobacter baumannii]